MKLLRELEKANLNLTAQNIYDLYVPSECEKRLYFRFHGEKETETDPFQEVLFDLGKRYEQEHLKTLTGVIDLSSVPVDDRINETKKAIENKAPVIYQGALRVSGPKDGKEITITGVPDFIILSGDSYIIRDCKLARKIDEKEGRHVEIIKQLRIYGYLFEKSIGKKPAGLEALLGTGGTAAIVYDNGKEARDELGKILKIISQPSTPYSPVGWSRCGGCGFRPICWDAAVKEKNAAIIPDVDKGTAIGLRVSGVNAIDELLQKFDITKLSALERPWGGGFQRVGKKAGKILEQAGVIKTGRHKWIEKIVIPASDNYVMFDIEGMPPYLDAVESMYLWGIKVYGKNPGTYMPALAPIEQAGDKKGWEIFLANCKKLFAEYGDIPFVHYAHYEKTKLKLYTERYGDPEGISARVERNLFDLFTAARKAVILAAPSYSLKVVEQLAGFKRTQDEYGGSWAMAQYIKAVETRDSAERDNLMKTIQVYNEEDLEAMWRTMQWLKNEGKN